MDYKFEKSKTGRMKVKEEFTPARRWSFLVGVNEKSHTAQSRLVKILANDEELPTLKEIESAFDIEKVSNEFFLKYRELFMRTKEELDKVIKKDAKIKADFEAKGVDSVNFTKKLLGQIVFLYFLQKKGWFGVGRDKDWGTGSKQFLRELFEKKHGNFFNDILEPLFYDALSRDRSDIDHWNDHFKCKIPFLNGGLFDPIGNYSWYNTDVLLPDKLFSNQNTTKESDIGDGILDVFDRYNFTVKEDEPLEKEVAIDPELLGKAYEKFNAIRPDNYEEYKKALKSGKKGEENKFNKKFAVFYTPPEIVHYMCQQSLINHLESEFNKDPKSFEKLGDSQLGMFGNVEKKGQLDLEVEHKSAPSISKEDIEALIHLGEQVGENEARVIQEGRETKTYFHKLPESIRNNATLIDQKLAEITVCDPAVGSGAFPVGLMSEIVKARNVLTNYIKDNTRSIYEFKRRCIEHSLYGVDIDPGAVEIAKLRLWLSMVVDEDNIKNIKPLPNLDYKIVRGNSLIGFPENWTSQISEEIEKLKDDYFNETNPAIKAKLKQQIDEKLDYRYENSTKNFGYKIDFDFRMVFSEIFQSKEGFDVIIANPPYGAKFSSTEKAILKSNYVHSAIGKFESYRIFIERGIQLLHTCGVLTYVVPNTWMFTEQALSLRKYLLDSFVFDNIISFPQEAFDVSVDSIAFVLRKSYWKKSHKVKIIDIPLAESLKNIRHYYSTASHYPQKNWSNSNSMVIAYGTKLTEQELVDRLCMQYDKFSDHVITKQGLIPYLTKEQSKENKYISNIKQNEKWKPYLDGSRCVGRYVIKEINAFIKYGKWLYAPREQWIFCNERIIFQLIRNISLKRRIVSTYLDYELYSDRNTGLIFAKDNTVLNIKYILAIFNSKLLNYIHSRIHNSTYISFPSILKLPLNSNPIKGQQPFIKAVENILKISTAKHFHECTKSRKHVESIEQEIDQMVYELYDLTPKEIKIVEGENLDT